MEVCRDLAGNGVAVTVLEWAGANTTPLDLAVECSQMEESMKDLLLHHIIRCRQCMDFLAQETTVMVLDQDIWVEDTGVASMGVEGDSITDGKGVHGKHTLGPYVTKPICMVNRIDISYICLSIKI